MAILGSLAMGTAIYNFANLSNVESEYPEHIVRSWATWKAKHKSGESYSSEAEHFYRLSVFKQNYDLVEATNSDPKLTYTLELNKFADLTNEEFTSQYLRNMPDHINQAAQPAKKAPRAIATETEWDWTKLGKVTRVKDQGQCGSCWAFATIGSLESLHKLNGGDLLEFSEQQLVDCATGSVWPVEAPNFGCNGGNPAFALQYTRDYGVMLENEYPAYEAAQKSCRYDASKQKFKNKTWHFETPLCNTCLRDSVRTQPVPVAVDGSAIQMYKGGIFNGSCNSLLTNHAVLAVGYGEENGTKFWKIKNSWSTSWGEAGYYRMSRSDSIGPGMCGIATKGVYPSMS